MSLAIRRVTQQDCRLLWEWANDPAVRAQSFTQATIPWDEHVRWFQRRLSSPDCAIFIISDDADCPVGQVRFQETSDGMVEVGISLGAEHRGRGLGVLVLRKACRAFARESSAGFVAHVKPKNEASLHIFERAGFTPAGTDQIAGTAAIRLELSALAVNVGSATGSPVLFVADAGPTIGLGHLQRSLALAAVLREQAPCVIATHDSEDSRNRVRNAGCDFAGQPALVSERGARQVDDTIGLTVERGCRTIVVDSYRVRASFSRALRSAGLRVVVLDDLALEPLAAHLVVNGGAQAPVLPYASSTGDTLFLLGPRYALLGPAFRQTDQRAVAPNVSRVLVVAGGDDPRGLLPQALAALDRVSAGFDVTLVVGPFCELSASLQGAIGRARHPVSVVRGPSHLRDLLFESDLLVSAAGQTLYEAAATGTPTIAVEVFDNQAGNIGALAIRGTVVSAGRVGDEGLVDRIAGLTDELVTDADRRRQLSEAGQRLVDGGGADRVAAEILSDRVRT